MLLKHRNDPWRFMFRKSRRLESKSHQGGISSAWARPGPIEWACCGRNPHSSPHHVNLCFLLLVGSSRTFRCSIDSFLDRYLGNHIQKAHHFNLGDEFSSFFLTNLLQSLLVQWIMRTYFYHHFQTRCTKCHSRIQKKTSCISELVGGLEHFLFFHILGMSSSQLIFIYFRGVQTTNQWGFWVACEWFLLFLVAGCVQWSRTGAAPPLDVAAGETQEQVFQNEPLLVISPWENHRKTIGTWWFNHGFTTKNGWSIWTQLTYGYVMFIDLGWFVEHLGSELRNAASKNQGRSVSTTLQYECVDIHRYTYLYIYIHICYVYTFVSIYIHM